MLIFFIPKGTKAFQALLLKDFAIFILTNDQSNLQLFKLFELILTFDLFCKFIIFVKPINDF